MIRFVMLSLVLMLSFPVSGLATDRTISQNTGVYIGTIETIDRQKKTKITVNGVIYSVSRALKVKAASKWTRVSNLSVGDTIRFKAKAAKRRSQLPKMVAIELELN